MDSPAPTPAATSPIDSLEARSALFQQMIEYGVDLVHVIDTEGTALYFSPSVERVLGYTPEELVGRSLLPLVHPDDLEEPLRLLKEHEFNLDRVHMLEQRVRHKDGSWRLMSVAGRFGRDPGGRPVVFVYSRDVTEQKRAEAAGRLEERIRALEEFAVGIKHQLSNSLTVLRAEAEPFLSSPSLSTEEQGSAAVVREEIERLAHLVRLVERAAMLARVPYTDSTLMLDLSPSANPPAPVANDAASAAAGPATAPPGP